MQQLYGALLRGPKGQSHAEDRGLAVSSPEGTKALGEGIRSLLECHVEFIHQGHHHLLPVRCPHPGEVPAALHPSWLLSAAAQSSTRASCILFPAFLVEPACLWGACVRLQG